MLVFVSHTGKHCNPVNVTELAIAAALETGPDVGHQDLGALQEAHFVAAAAAAVLVAVAALTIVLVVVVALAACGHVAEAGEPVRQEIDQRDGRLLRPDDTGREA